MCEKSFSVSSLEGVAVIQAIIGGVWEQGGNNDSEVIFCMCLEGKTRRIREVLAVECEQKKGVKDGPSARWSPHPLDRGQCGPSGSTSRVAGERAEKAVGSINQRFRKEVGGQKGKCFKSSERLEEVAEVGE